MVLALPRGGVPVGRAVADALGAELDILVACKVGVPWHRELGMAAVTADGAVAVEERVLAGVGVDRQALTLAVAHEQARARRLWSAYRGDAPTPILAGRDVVLVDDGLATGVTMRAALRDVAQRGPGPPARVVVAVPVGSADSLAALAELGRAASSGESFTVVCPLVPATFRAVSTFYADFRQVDDDEVLACLARR